MEAAPPSLIRVCVAPDDFPLDLHSQPIGTLTASKLISSLPYRRVCVPTRTHSSTVHSHHLRSSSHAHPILQQT
jgi:hypothetical protein